MGEIIKKKIKLFSSAETLKVTLNYEGGAETLKTFEKIEERFYKNNLEFAYVTTFDNISMLENKIWFEWANMIDEESDIQKQMEMTLKQRQYMAQARALSLSLGKDLYKGYTALCYSVYSGSRERHVDYDAILVETETELEPELHASLKGEKEISIGERSLKWITEQLEDSFSKIMEGGKDEL